MQKINENGRLKKFVEYLNLLNKELSYDNILEFNAYKYYSEQTDRIVFYLNSLSKIESNFTEKIYGIAYIILIFSKGIIYNLYWIIKSILLRIKLKKKIKFNKIIITGLNNKYTDIICPIYESFNSDDTSVIMPSECSEEFKYSSFIDINYFYRINRRLFGEIKNIWKTNSEIINYNKRKNIEVEYSIFIYYIIFHYSIKEALIKSNIRKFEPEKIKAIYTTNYIDELSKILYLYTKNGTKKFGIKRGLTGDNIELEWFRGDLLFVKSKYEKKLFENRGLSKDEIVITDMPLYQKIGDKLNKNLKLINWSKAGKFKAIYCYLTQPTNKYFNKKQQIEEINTLINFSKKFNIGLLIKVHPSEVKSNIYRSIKNKKNVFISYDKLYECINFCDLAITKFSGTGIDALYLGKPLVIINYNHNYPSKLNIYIKHSLGKVINNRCDLQALFQCNYEKSELLKNIKSISNLFGRISADNVFKFQKDIIKYS